MTSQSYGPRPTQAEYDAVFRAAYGNIPGTTWYSPTATTGGGPAPIQIATPTTPVPADQISSVTGIDPAEVAAATYGKIIPIWVGGVPRLGGHIIYGPTFTTIVGIIHTSFGVSFGMPADNTGTRQLRELRLDGFKVWSLTEGYLTTGLTFRFYGGTETQTADPLVAAAFPTAQVAHKGQCCVFIENLELTNYAGKVPFVSAQIADTTEVGDPDDGILLGFALETIAASPYVNLPVADFETTGIAERVDAVIVAEKMSFLDLCGRFARLHLWDVVQTDKLRVIERGTVDPDISLDFTNILGASDSPPITIERAQQSDVPRELDYSWIDSARDYEINTVTVSRPREPVPVTVSAGKDSIALPAVHTIEEALSWATLRRYKDELARETISFTTSITGFEIEPGDIIAVDAGFKTYNLRVLETLKGANWSNRIKAEPILRCAPPTFTSFDPVNITSLYLWLKGDELPGADGSAVATWPDESGNNFDFTQAAALDQPHLQTNELNNLSVVRFVGINTETLNGPDISGPTAGSLFYVIRAGFDPTTGVVQGATHFGTSAAGPHFPFNDGHIYTSDLRASRLDVGDPATTLLQFNIIGVISGTNDWRYYINGTLLFSTTSNADPTFNTNPQIGGVGLFPIWYGDIAEVIAFSDALSQTNRQYVEGYLAHKWNLTANLDVLHPYKIVAP